MTPRAGSKHGLGWLHLLILFVTIAVPPSAFSGREGSALSRALVGRQVVVAFDMPLHAHGVDLDASNGFQRDDGSRLGRLGAWGMAFQAGDTATVTEVRVGRKRVEIILGAGGLSTTALMNTRDPRFQVISDPARQLDPGPHTTQRDARQSEQDQRMVTGEIGRAGARAELARVYRVVSDTTGEAVRARPGRAATVYVPEAGSRLRLGFKHGVPKEMLVPETLIEALSEQVILLDPHD